MLQEYEPPLLGDAFDRQADHAKACLFIWLGGPVVAFLVIYLIGSFTAGTTNPAEWTADSRGLAVLPWLLLSAAIIITGHAMLSDLTETQKKLMFWYEQDKAKGQTIVDLNKTVAERDARIVELEDDLVKAKAGRRARIER